ncbi:MAG: hypothetical protein RLZZ324_698 [Candidatus Parcubacteria bacterium]|jgi:rubrerythrin
MSVREFTKRWWEAQLSHDQGGMVKWLVRLRATEHFAALRFQNALDRWAFPDAEKTLFSGIMGDEYRHSRMVTTLLRARDIPFPEELVIGRERYWEQIWHHVTDYRLACASLMFGETLAITRFEVIAEHPDTPEDVRALIALIIPDERRHISTLSAIAGKDGRDAMRGHHREGMKAIGVIADDDGNDD